MMFIGAPLIPVMMIMGWGITAGVPIYFVVHFIYNLPILSAVIFISGSSLLLGFFSRMIFFIAPNWIVLKSLSTVNLKAVKEGNPLFFLVDTLSIKMGVDTPLVYLEDVDVLNARVSSIGRRDILILAKDLLNLPPNEIEFIVAHELAHIKNHDTAIIAFQSNAFVGWNIGYAILHSILIILSKLPLIRSIAPLFNLYLRFINLLMGMVGNIVIPFWNVLSRNSEYKADALAADISSLAGGINFLGRFKSKPYSLGLFSTHPKPEARVRELING